MSSPLRSKTITVTVWAAIAAAADLATKHWAMNNLSETQPRVVIENLFNLILAYNYGAAFSIFADAQGANHGVKMALLALVSMLPLVYFLYRAKPSDKAMLVGLGLIMGGALGNIHDRLRWNKVVDFLDLYLNDYHWPTFNVADIAICVGVGLMFIAILKEKPEKE